MRWPLDHLFTSQEFRVKKLERTGHIKSDHFPVYSELTYEPQGASLQLPQEPTDSEIKSAKSQLKEQNLLNMGVN